MQEQPAEDSVVVERAQLRAKGQVTLPAQVRRALQLKEGDEVEFTVGPDGQVALRGLTVIPTDQRWFWTQEWQEGEREASAAIAAGKTTSYDNTEEFLAALDHLDSTA
jgi:AbrB family looped-hinge helix DNA binding protein